VLRQRQPGSTRASFDVTLSSPCRQWEIKRRDCFHAAFPSCSTTPRPSTIKTFWLSTLQTKTLLAIDRRPRIEPTSCGTTRQAIQSCGARCPLARTPLAAPWKFLPAPSQPVSPSILSSSTVLLTGVRTQLRWRPPIDAAVPLGEDSYVRYDLLLARAGHDRQDAHVWSRCLECGAREDRFGRWGKATDH
jgi:hypothetical protein